MELTLAPAHAQVAAIRAGRTTSRELLEQYLERIRVLDPMLNAVVSLDADRARAEADRCDAETGAGTVRGPLHGLPCTVKDALAVAGMPTTSGSTSLADHVPEEDAPAVARLKHAGAIVFGRTNVPQWCADLQSTNDLFGTTNNPWDVRRTPGGSSGGAAVAVAAGLSSFDIGTDIAGSIRYPAHFCGVYGLKTSYGIVPQGGYIDCPGGRTADADINVVGPLARSAEDLDLLLDVLVAPADRGAGWHVELPVPRWSDRGQIRLAAWFEEEQAPLDPAYRLQLARLVDRLSDAGIRVVNDRPPVDFGEQVELFDTLLYAAAAPSRPKGPPEQELSHIDWLRAHDRRLQLARVWASWFDDYDAVLCPVTLSAAFPHMIEGGLLDRTIEIDGRSRPYLDMLRWAGLVGVLGLPAAAVPVGLDAAGLPVGVQVVAPRLHDRTAVAVAREISAVIGGYQPPPLARRTT